MLEDDVNKELNNAIGRQDKGLKVESLIVECKDVCMRLIAKNEEVFELIERIENPQSTSKNLEYWPSRVTTKNDDLLTTAIEYIDSVEDRGTAVQRIISRRSKLNGRITCSRASSQRKHNLTLA